VAAVAELDSLGDYAAARSLQHSMKSWSPPHFEVGAHVIAPEHSDWGVGEVLDAQLVGELRFKDGPVYQLHPRSPGQRLQVRFADGRTRTVITADTPLKPAPHE
jgi:hypothetical protein